MTPVGSTVVLGGVPRSGSTWIAEVLTADDAVTLVHEPDNHDLNVAALRAKRGLGAFPSSPNALQSVTGLAQLWEAATDGHFDRTTANLKLQRSITRKLRKPLRNRWLDDGVGPAWLSALVAGWPNPAGRPATTSHVLVKTVHACRMLDWLVARDLGAVAVVRRDGADVVSSWHRLGWRGQPWAAATLREASCDDLIGDEFAELAATALALVCQVDRAATRNDLVVIDYAQASRDPEQVIGGAAVNLGLPWGHANEDAIASREQAGAGYATNRERGAGLGVAATRLSGSQQSMLSRLRRALDDPTMGMNQS